jgi:hypothetical protein
MTLARLAHEVVRLAGTLTGPVDRTIPHFAAALIHNITILRLGNGVWWVVD